jgi:dUTP pyrophosphatase
VKKQNNKEQNKMQVRIKKLSPEAVIPTYAKDGDAGMDLVATSMKFDGTQITYGTGLAMEIPEGFVGLVFPRSSIRKTDLSLSNSVGVIDSGYRGEIQATFNQRSLSSQSGSFVYGVGDRIMQIIIIPHPPIEFKEVDELTNTERGEGGFGSTGK